MSTGFECEFFSTPDGRHFYTLQNWDCPVGAWDWREYSTTYGPFTSHDNAHNHLSNNHANPGGYSISELTEISPATQKVIDGARL